MRRFLTGALTALSSIGLADLLIPGGLACVVYGVAQVWVPAAWMIGGIFVAGFGFILARGERKEHGV